MITGHSVSLSAHRPNLPNRKESLFLESSFESASAASGPISAESPFDASAIVESALNTPPARRVRVVLRRPKEQPAEAQQASTTRYYYY